MEESVNSKNIPLFEHWNSTASNANMFSIPVAGSHGNK